MLADAWPCRRGHSPRVSIVWAAAWAVLLSWVVCAIIASLTVCERARRGASPRKCYWETCRAVVKRLPRVARPAPGRELEDAAMQFLAEKAHLDDNVRAPRESAYTACYASGVAVERWKDGCLGAVSLTSDDGRWSAIDVRAACTPAM